MATPVTLNGISYSIPAYLDTGWAQGAGNLSLFLAAIPGCVLQLSGGAFTLTADVNFGASYGLLSKYFTSVSSNAASAGAVRLANGDTLDFRNHANSGDLALSVNSSDQLVFNGTIISSTGVSSITGTANQIIASASTGAITLSTPQDIGTGSKPTFTGLSLEDSLEMLSENTIQFDDAGANNINLSAPNAISSSYSLLLPTAQGAANTSLVNDGSGNLSWTYPGQVTTSISGGGSVSFSATGIATVLVLVDADTNFTTITDGFDGQKLLIRLTQDSAGHAVTFATGATNNVEFGTTIPSFTASGANLIDYIGLVFNGSRSRWDFVSLSQGF